MPGRYPDGDGDELINRMVDVEEAASGAEKLKSFYAQYITNVLEDKDEANEALLAESVDPFYLEYWADPKKRVQEVNENMLKSLDVEPLGSPGWYKVSWSCGAGEETILVVKFGKMKIRNDLSAKLFRDKEKAFAKGTDKMMIRYDGFFYLTPAKRKAFANESEALNNQAVELCVRNLSNQDSIAQAMELWDKAIALNHLNLHAYSSKANLLIGKQRYDEALKTLDNAICFHPENHGLYLTEGVLLEKLGRMDDAMLHYQRGLELCEYQFKKIPLLGTFIDYYLLRYSVSRKDIPNAEIIDAIPASFSKDHKDCIINMLDEAGSIQKIHSHLLE
jgi:tetratricopeptide (TPR) repeat protein